MLVSIYGDEIYTFPLTNNPMGLYNYCSSNIHLVIKYLDLRYDSLKYLKSMEQAVINDTISKNEIDGIEREFKNYYDSTIYSIKYVIAEYNKCQETKISRIDFEEEIREYSRINIFMDDYILFEKRGHDLVNEIECLIQNKLIKKENKEEITRKMKKFLHFS